MEIKSIVCSVSSSLEAENDLLKQKLDKQLLFSNIIPWSEKSIYFLFRKNRQRWGRIILRHQTRNEHRMGSVVLLVIELPPHCRDEGIQ